MHSMPNWNAYHVLLQSPHNCNGNGWMIIESWVFRSKMDALLQRNGVGQHAAHRHWERSAHFAAYGPRYQCRALSIRSHPSCNLDLSFVFFPFIPPYHLTVNSAKTLPLRKKSSSTRYLFKLENGSFWSESSYPPQLVAILPFHLVVFSIATYDGRYFN